MSFPGKKVSILGLGRSGFEAALFLKSQGFEIFASESSESSDAQEKASLLAREQIEVEIGKHSITKILESHWVLPSPGIKPSHPVLQKVLELNIPVLSEIEVASRFSASKNIIAITGTAGKTTVATLIAEILKKEKKEVNVFLCGNIGTPWISMLQKIKEEDYVVLEVSSFQLAFCVEFKPKVAVLLNLYPNHLDWHSDMKDYIESKFKIFQNQTEEDYALLRKEERERLFKEREIKSQVVCLDEENDSSNDPVIRKVATLLNCSHNVTERTLVEFEGIEHRLERVLRLGGIDFVNDSKSTTTASLIWALSRYSDKSVVLIAGGKPKSSDFEVAAKTIQQKVTYVVLIGESSDEMQKAWESFATCKKAESLEQAVRLATEKAESGDTVLLSPACASFDMFKSYEDRGEQFKALVCELNTKDVSSINQIPKTRY